MATNPTEYAERLIDFLQGIVSDPDRAQEYLNDREGVLDQLGEPDLSGIDLHGVVSSACAGVDLAPSARAAVSSLGVSGSGGSGPTGAVSSSAPPPPPAVAPAGEPPLQTVIRTVDYVTYVTHQENQVITQNFVDSSVDNSQTVNINADEGFDGIIEVELENESVNATGDRAVAAGRDANAATGDGSTAVGGNNNGTIQSNSGDGAVQVGGDNSAPINTGTNTGIIADGDVDNAILSGGGDVQATQVDGDVEDSAIGGFGSGDTNRFDDVNDSNVTTGDGNQTSNFSDVDVDDGSAISTGGPAAGSNVDIEDSFNEETDVEAINSNVSTEQGSGAGQAETDESAFGEDGDDFEID